MSFKHWEEDRVKDVATLGYFTLPTIFRNNKSSLPSAPLPILLTTHVRRSLPAGASLHRNAKSSSPFDLLQGLQGCFQDIPSCNYCPMQEFKELVI